MQISSHHLRPPGIKTREFEYPAYSPLEFIRVLQVCEIAMMCVCVMSERTFSFIGVVVGYLYIGYVQSEVWEQYFGCVCALSCIGEESAAFHRNNWYSFLLLLHLPFFSSPSSSNFLPLFSSLSSSNLYYIVLLTHTLCRFISGGGK